MRRPHRELLALVPALPAADHRTIMNVGLAMLVFVGLGYLLGQFYDRRAFLLLAWWGIAVLPAILSQDPADRRMAMVFPASHALAGSRPRRLHPSRRQRGGRLAGVLAEHRRGRRRRRHRAHQPRVPPAAADQPGAVQRLPALHPAADRETSDAIFTNMPDAVPVTCRCSATSIISWRDRPAARSRCRRIGSTRRSHRLRVRPIRSIGTSPSATGRPRRCARTITRKRISYLLTEDPTSAPIDRAAAGPASRRQARAPPVPRAERDAGVDDRRRGRHRRPARADVDRRRADRQRAGRRPAARAGGGRRRSGRRGELRRDRRHSASTAMAGTAGASIRLARPRPLTFDGQPISQDVRNRCSPGVHPFTLAVPVRRQLHAAAAHHLIETSEAPQRSNALAAKRYVSRAVAALPDVRAPKASTAIDGYAPPVKAIQFRVSAGRLRRRRPGEHLRPAAARRRRLSRCAASCPTARRWRPGGCRAADHQPRLDRRGARRHDRRAGPAHRPLLRADGQGDRQLREHPWLVWESQLAFWGDYSDRQHPPPQLHRRVQAQRRGGEGVQGVRGRSPVQVLLADGDRPRRRRRSAGRNRPTARAALQAGRTRVRPGASSSVSASTRSSPAAASTARIACSCPASAASALTAAAAAG